MHISRDSSPVVMVMQDYTNAYAEAVHLCREAFNKPFDALSKACTASNQHGSERCSEMMCNV